MMDISGRRRWNLHYLLSQPHLKGRDDLDVWRMGLVVFVCEGVIKR